MMSKSRARESHRSCWLAVPSGASANSRTGGAASQSAPIPLRNTAFSPDRKSQASDTCDDIGRRARARLSPLMRRAGFSHIPLERTML